MTAEFYVNAPGTKRLILSKKEARFTAGDITTTHAAAKADLLIEKNHLVKIPVTHNQYILTMKVGEQQAHVSVKIFELQPHLAGLWFRGEVTRLSADRKTFPCYFTLLPHRVRRGVYRFIPRVCILHLEGGDVSSFPQHYDEFEPIAGTEFRQKEIDKMVGAA